MNETIAIPTEIKRAVDGLDDNTRWLILEALINNNNMTYTGLQKKLGIHNNGKLNYHLAKLLKTSLIERLEDWDNENIMSYYEISSFGKGVIHGLLTSLTPSSKISKNKKSAPLNETYTSTQLMDVIDKDSLTSTFRGLTPGNLYRKTPEISYLSSNAAT